MKVYTVFEDLENGKVRFHGVFTSQLKANAYIDTIEDDERYWKMYYIESNIDTRAF